MAYPDRRSASTSVAYSQTAKMGTTVRVETPRCSKLRTMWSAR
jgi:hypothetical protein